MKKSVRIVGEDEAGGLFDDSFRVISVGVEHDNGHPVVALSLGYYLQG